jgi:hypothetical protein
MNLKKLKRMGHAGGAKATQIVRTNLYGTRYSAAPSAARAPSQISALGVGPRSVWDGPRIRKNGAPALKRQQPA